VNVLKSFQ
jgi:hypothetical protein